MKISAWWKTDKGLKRENNQDSFLVNEGLGLFIVADGMGGHSGGEVASQLAVKTTEEFVFQNASRLLSSRDLLSQAYSAACKRIFDMANNEAPELIGMGTTMVLIYARENSLFIGNVGDSRAYLFREGKLWQLTEDHSLLNEQMRAGLINENQAKNFVNKNVITRSVGYERNVDTDVLERPLVKGDKYILCTDGLTGMVSDEELCKIITNNKSARAVDECIAKALTHGGEDNVTVVLVEIGSDL